MTNSMSNSMIHSTPWRLTGKKALVTGASKGIGKAIVEEFLALGCEVIAVARQHKGLEAAFPKTVALNQNVHFLAADIGTQDAAAKIVADVEKRWGQLDILVNNAGTNIRKRTVEQTDTEIATILDTNLIGALALTRACHPLLCAAKPTSVVFVSSVAGARPVLTGAAYAISKAGLDQLARYLAVEWAADGIRVNAVAPWYIDTPLAAPVLADQERLAKILSRTPLGRIGLPEEVARAVAFFALPAAGYVTGQVLAVDGGFMQAGIDWR